MKHSLKSLTEKIEKCRASHSSGFFSQILLLFLPFFIFQLFSCKVSAQTDSVHHYLLTTKSSAFEIGSVTLVDPYFTTTRYSGTGMSFSQHTARFFDKKERNFSMQSVFSLTGALLSNPTESGGMFYASLRKGWGANYHFRPSTHWMFLVGGLWDMQLGLKELPRYVNNPFNMDLCTNLNLTGSAYWNFVLLKREMRLIARFESPALGYMFVPESGASYYEMFQLGSMQHAFHLSSFPNKMGLTQTYKLDIPLNWAVVEVGMRWQYLKYKANDMVFTNNQLAFVLGTTFDVISFGGRKRKAPSNFLNATY